MKFQSSGSEAVHTVAVSNIFFILERGNLILT